MRCHLNSNKSTLQLSHFPVFLLLLSRSEKRKTVELISQSQKHVKQFHFISFFLQFLLIFVHLFYIPFSRFVFYSKSDYVTLNDKMAVGNFSWVFNHAALFARGEPSMLSTSIGEFSGSELLFMAVSRMACVIPFSQNARVLRKCFVIRSTLLSNRC